MNHLIDRIQAYSNRPLFSSGLHIFPAQGDTRSVLLLILFLSLSSLCFSQKEKDKDKTKEEGPIERPIEQWVFKAVLGDLPGAVVVALHQDIWLAYNPNTADLYQAWRGRVKFQGAVYTGVPGEQPEVDGFPFVVNALEAPSWEVKLNGKTEKPSVQWQGYRIQDNDFIAMYRLLLSDGQEIHIEEQPEYVSVKRSDNRSSFQRSFTIKQAPPGAEIRLGIELDGMIRRGDIQSNAKFADVDREKRHFEWGTLYNFDGKLILEREEPTVLILTFAIDPEKEASTTGN